MTIRNLRVVQYVKNGSVLVRNEHGEMTIRPGKENVSWKLQMAVDRADGIEWVDVDIIEVDLDDVR